MQARLKLPHAFFQPVPGPGRRAAWRPETPGYMAGRFVGEDTGGRAQKLRCSPGFVGTSKSFLQLSLNCHNLPSVKQQPTPAFEILEGHCAGAQVCPLSRVQAGTVVCIKHLSTTPEVTERLRELGFREEQRIKILSRQSNFICQVCNARLGISERLADSILVETVPASPLGA